MDKVKYHALIKTCFFAFIESHPAHFPFKVETAIIATYLSSLLAFLPCVAGLNELAGPVAWDWEVILLQMEGQNRILSKRF